MDKKDGIGEIINTDGEISTEKWSNGLLLSH